MKRIVSDTKTITLLDLVELITSSAKQIVFYNSQSTGDNESYPMFFKKIGTGYGFSAPIFGYGDTYVYPSILESLSAVSKAGKGLFVIERSEISQLFKKQ